MTRISTDQDVLTLINVFTVSPDDQQRLVDVLVDATRSSMSRRPGYVSANIHRSLDGTTVTNYAQWRSREDFEAMLADADARVHMDAATALAERVEPQLYEVAFAEDDG